MTDTTQIAHRSGPVAQRPAQFDYILLDRSGSMHSKWWGTLASIDVYLEQMAMDQIPTTVTISSFAGDLGDVMSYTTHCNKANPAACKAAEVIQYGPGGGTPLYDAINTMVRETAAENPIKCSILIFTDGEATSSKTTLEEAKNMLDWCRRKGWQITFIGCDFNNQRQTALLGAGEASAIGVAQKRLSDATRALGEKRKNYSLYGTPMGYTADEKEQFGGFLSDHSNGRDS